MIIDPADYEDTMKLPRQPQKKRWSRFGKAVRVDYIRFRHFDEKHLITRSTTVGGLK
jgi:hypothetical protein